MCVCAQLCLTLTPWTVNRQAPLSMEFPGKNTGVGLPFPSPGYLPDSGIELRSLASPALTGGFFYNFWWVSSYFNNNAFQKSPGPNKKCVCVLVVCCELSNESKKHFKRGCVQLLV